MSKIVPTDNFFFVIFANKIIYFINGQYFPTIKKGKKKKRLRLPDWPQYRPSATLETDLFFRVALAGGQCLMMSSVHSVFTIINIHKSLFPLLGTGH